MTKKEKIVSFVWQHLLLLVSLFIMTLGVALCVKSMLGSSVISVLPYVFQEAGDDGLVPALTIGEYTYIMNAILVVGQIGVLRRRFDPIQLFQLLVGFVFGMLLDFNMYLTSWLEPVAFWEKATAQLVGCTVLAVGVALEVRCGSVTMPGEGFPVAVSRVLGMDFPRVKIAVDTSLVMLGIIACYAFFGGWQWHIIGIGTLFAMYYVGFAVRIIGHHLSWFDRLLKYRPGFRRYLYGLAKYIYRK
jgi:uncharacterized membrane protein YczE